MSKINNQKIIKNMEQQKEDNNFINNKSTRSVLRIVKSETTQDG